MPSLSPETYQRCRKILLKCKQFDTHASLRSLFSTTGLDIFRGGVPEADSRDARVDVFLDYLSPKYLSDGRPVLPLFIAALRDRYESGDALWNELEMLCKEIERQMTYPPQASQEKQVSPESSKADVLLITATEVEARTTLGLFERMCDRKYQRRFIGDQVYYDLGMIGGAGVFMVQSEMGTAGLGASLLTVQNGIKALSPCAIIMVGIAFGVNPEKQKVADILVSKQLMLYDLQKIDRENGKQKLLPRGARPNASPKLLSLFRSGAKDWHGPQPDFGLVLSGEKLINDQDYRDQLRQLEEEAIGGEMEGAGLYVAAQSNKSDWILVKAICDWADGNKGYKKFERQKVAAQSAAAFVLHVLLQGGLGSVVFQEKADHGLCNKLEEYVLALQREVEAVNKPPE
ncbi:MAG: hypothetical protein NT169_20080 [Chloroflexi bacterium]|nr:hypothetical protein [Chloroflexota bacterium]